ncbi:hypothetical protein EDD18DRAFT_1427991 [Armillaria luteobubalina]|uniref:F-box domain-containing protein n=1 Tax=Armillaria luteobubalina TaxID=153913 RepID=A0AA39PKY6_9AGAR|nr:hypothetical protein EDD18DRAFT_1427991 [Armillaria luteobubalina]
MHLDAMHRVRTGVQGVLAHLTSITLDGIFFSSLAKLASFFRCIPHLKRLVMNVITVGRGNGDDGSHKGGLCKELEMLKVGTGNLHPRWMHFLFGRDSTISLESLRELVFPVTSEVDSWMPGMHELLGQALRLESAMLPDWRGSHQNLNHIITPVPDIGRLCSLMVFIPLAYTDQYEVQRALISNNTKMNKADTAISALDWMRRMLDTGTRLEEVVLIVRAHSMVGDEGVKEAWGRLLRRNVVACPACNVDQNLDYYLGVTQTFGYLLPTSLETFILSNAPPSHDDCTLIKESLLSLTSKSVQLHNIIAEQDEAIAALSLILDHYKDSHEEMLYEQSCVDDLIEHHKRALSSPICRVPIDIMQEIFLLVSFNAADITDFAWIATHTCTEWRDITKQTPMLWSKIHIDMDIRTYIRPYHSVDMPGLKWLHSSPRPTSDTECIRCALELS